MIWFLLRLHPKVSTSMIVTGPEHVERVLKHSLVFSPEQARKVLPKLNKVLTKHHGWTRYVSKPGEYVVYEHGGTNVSYMSDRVHRHLIGRMAPPFFRRRREVASWNTFTLIHPNPKCGTTYSPTMYSNSVLKPTNA